MPAREAEFDVRPVPSARSPLSGRWRLPGSKSLTQRALMLAAIARGRSRIVHPLEADDPRNLLHGLGQLGLLVERETDADGMPVWSLTGGGGLLDGGVRIDVGEGGTGARFLTTLATLAAAPVVVDGQGRLRERPMGEGVEMLAALGATVEATERSGCLPLRVAGGGLEGGTMRVGPTASSQFLSAILLTAAASRRGVRLELATPPTSAPYLWMTLDMLAAAGVAWTADRPLPRVGADEYAEGPSVIEVPAQPVHARVFEIEPDASSALFTAAAAALVPGSEVVLEGLAPDSRQPDLQAIRALEAFGASVSSASGGVRVVAATGVVPASLDCRGMPDAVPMLAAIAHRAVGRSRFTGLATLRVKESDRIEAIVSNLRAIGGEAEGGSDWLEVVGVGDADGAPAVIDPRHDHRIAMAFATLGLVRPGLAVADPGCTTKSDPEFWTRLDRLAGVAAPD
jgi:3-phosphoshikimate 1-carboxyvinyltransferase